jgi:hypothetical protein
MKDQYYKRLGTKIAEYVAHEKYTFIELGKIFEQYYLIVKNEEMRDSRDERNGK